MLTKLNVQVRVEILHIRFFSYEFSLVISKPEELHGKFFSTYKLHTLFSVKRYSIKRSTDTVRYFSAIQLFKKC